MSLTKQELKHAAELLSLAAESFSHRGCNDYFIADTLENRQIVQNLICWSGDQDLIIHFGGGDFIRLEDWLFMRYLRSRLLEEAGE